jgi:hypothetical protein
MVERFDLERFGWNAPDRLEVSGQFHGLEHPPADPVLIVNGDGTPHRLQAAADTVPADAGQWRAEFVWDGAPVGVDSAVLKLDPDIVIELPAPGAEPAALDVRHADVDGEPAGFALQAQRLAAEQETAELRAALERAEAELARARSDLDGERSGRATDAERFRDGLAQVQASAEQALAAERAQAAHDAEALREELETARAQAANDTEALREELETARAQAANDAEALREELETARAQAEHEADGLRQRLGAVEHAGTEAGELRADAERLLERVTRLADALDAGK